MTKISELVLSAVTASFQNVQSCCEAIADRTNKLVIIAQQVAISSTDNDTQLEVAGAINTLAACIEKLVVTFTEILATNNERTQEGFAAAAKDVGEAINKLVQSTDTTSGQKLLQAVNEAMESAKQVVASNSKEVLLQTAQLLVERSVRVVKVATLAASTTADEKKKALLTDGAAKVKAGSPSLIQAAKQVSERGFDPNAKGELNNRANTFYSALEELRNAAKLSPVYFGKVAETYEYVKRLIEAARQLEEAATNLYNITNNKSATPEQFIESAKATATRALALVEQAENAMKLEKDPVKKELLRDAIRELREASQAVLQAAKAYRQNPNDPNLKAKFEEEHARLERAIKRVVGLTNGELYDDTPKGKLRATADALEYAANNLSNICYTNPQETAKEAPVVTAIGMQLAKQIETYVNEVGDPATKKKLVAEAAEIKSGTQRLVSAAQKVASNPNDVAAQKELNDAHNYVLDKIGAVRRDAQLVSASSTAELDNVSLDFDMASGKPEELQLAQAAKDEAQAALQLASEAENIVSKMVDPIKKQKMLAAIGEVKAAAQRVMEAAEYVTKNPKDAAAQQRLAQAQKELSAAIEKVVALTEDKDRDIADAMAEMRLESEPKSKEALVLQAAQAVLDDIAKAFSSNENDPQKVIAVAKQLAAKAAELSKQLRELAEKTTDPVFKEKLMNAAKIIRDSGIQVKILSAVRAAGGEDKSNSVGSAIKSMKTNIQEVIKEVEASSIKNKFRATVQTTIAINKVVNAWKKRAGKK